LRGCCKASRPWAPGYWWRPAFSRLRMSHETALSPDSPRYRLSGAVSLCTVSHQQTVAQVRIAAGSGVRGGRRVTRPSGHWRCGQRRHAGTRLLCGRPLRCALQRQASEMGESPRIRKTVATVLSGQSLIAEAAAQLGHVNERITMKFYVQIPSTAPMSATHWRSWPGAH
jgi:hypothetical protein